MTARVRYNTFKVSGTNFEIESRFSPIKPVGHGAYGVVISASDQVSGKKVAIKKIPKAFDDAIDAKRILREIRLLKQFDHENVIKIVEILAPATLENFDDVYIVQELMETDLHRIIYSRQTLTIDHVQYFIYQILRALKYIHAANVLHRDLKPSNVLVNSNCDLKICDFGLARAVEEARTPLTEYVVTRWYRAPEIMLSCKEYTKSIDVWSVGCIFAELLNRRPLFPGDDYMHQLRLICEKLGRPNDEGLDFVTTERARRYILSLQETAATAMTTLFPGTGTQALNLLAQMLQFHPRKRITVEQALEHPFMATLHNPDDEPSAQFQFNFEFEDHDLPSDSVRELIYQEMRSYNPRLPETLPRSSRDRSSRRDTVDSDEKECSTTRTTASTKND